MANMQQAYGPTDLSSHHLGMARYGGNYTKADFERSEIGDDLPVADHVR